jgi:uncharacterized protein
MLTKKKSLTGKMQIKTMNWLTTYRIKRYLKKHHAIWSDLMHGCTHWRKVETIGLAMARKNGADQAVVSLFAWLHDSCREGNETDLMHGERSAKLVRSFRKPFLSSLSDEQFEKLHYALKFHAHGLICDDTTVGTCWDADRLDLGRVGTIPKAEYMSTAEGKMLVARVKKGRN